VPSSKKTVLKRLHFPFAEPIQLANVARPLLPRGCSVLYHGSRSPKEILHENVLRVPESGILAVSFTRMLHVAIFWATLKREDESVGAVFALDRNRLAHTYRLEPFRDPFWDNDPKRRVRNASEAEEHVWGRDVTWLHRFLVNVIWFLPDGTVKPTKKLNTQKVRRSAVKLLA
jgi:hypothetical protein